jgi:hypothetical protein
VAAAILSALAITTTGTPVFALPHTVLAGQPVLLGLRTHGSGETATYDVRYPHGPEQRVRAVSNSSGYQIVRLTVPRLAVTPTSKDQRFVATVGITLTHVDGLDAAPLVETRTVRFAVLVPRRK